MAAPMRLVMGFATAPLFRDAQPVAATLTG
jgi:hypothetical protein